jgi:hypothetical protein
MATTSHYLVAAGLADTIFLIVSLTTSRNDYFISLACRKGSCGNKLRDTSKFARALHREKQNLNCYSKSLFFVTQSTNVASFSPIYEKYD